MSYACRFWRLLTSLYMHTVPLLGYVPGYWPSICDGTTRKKSMVFKSTFRQITSLQERYMCDDVISQDWDIPGSIVTHSSNSTRPSRSSDADHEPSSG
eukprot:scaffold565247_cov79-Attheya_sp.AAC.1